MFLQSPDENLRCSSHAAELPSPDSSINDIFCRDGFRELDLGGWSVEEGVPTTWCGVAFKAAPCVSWLWWLPGRKSLYLCTYPKSQVSTAWLSILGLVL